MPDERLSLRWGVRFKGRLISAHDSETGAAWIVEEYGDCDGSHEVVDLDEHQTLPPYSAGKPATDPHDATPAPPLVDKASV